MVAVSFTLISFLCFLFVIIISNASAQICDNSKGNYTTNSTYQKNLNTLLSSFSSNKEIYYGFYSISYGQDPDKVYAIGLCRGDQNTDKCLSCLNNSRANLAKNCPNQKEAIDWPGECMLRYSNRPIFGLLETNPTLYAWNTANAKDVDRFNEALQNLMTNLTVIAASGDSRRKYATGTRPTANFQSLYSYTQCTPDLSYQDCFNCLSEAISNIPQCCSGKVGGNVMKPSCRIRYDPYSYFGPTLKLDPDAPPPSPPFTNNTYSQGKSNTSRTIIFIVVPVASVVLVLSPFCIYLNVRKSTKKFVSKSLQFNFDTIRVATNEFDDSAKLGQGEFGAVYKGQLSNGQEIAVKKLSRDSSQGDEEFENEVHLLRELQHRNLVRLLGFCLEGREKLLVYEFVPNRSLDYFLFDRTKRAQLDWGKRYKIIVGIARGILYLHQDSRLHIIHRDLKPGNILLDEKMNPKISDFGLARLFVVDQTHGITKRIIGTEGYMAPEYEVHGKFSEKSDVFSFGVLILEVISGQKNSCIRRGENIEDLLSFSWRNWRKGTPTNIVDSTLNKGPQNEITRCIHIGLLCVQENVVARPTVNFILTVLTTHSLPLEAPLEPAFNVAATRSREYTTGSASTQE